jgi:hypothetical protein
MPSRTHFINVAKNGDNYYVEITEKNCRSIAKVSFVIEDTEPPVMQCKDDTIYLDRQGQATITVNDINDGSFDNCSLRLWLDKTDFDCDDLGENIVRLFGRDSSGNESWCDATVTVLDTISPVANCIAPFVVYLRTGGTATLTAAQIDNGSSDNCGGPVFEIDKYFFDCDDVGTHTITLTVYDSSGNSSICTTEITIIGNEPPVAQDDFTKALANQNTLYAPVDQRQRSQW